MTTRVVAAFVEPVVEEALSLIQLVGLEQTAQVSPPAKLRALGKSFIKIAAVVLLVVVVVLPPQLVALVGQKPILEVLRDAC